MDSFFTWEMLLSYSGATIATALLTQFVKEVKPVSHVNARLLSYFIALALMEASIIASRGLRWDEMLMAVINAAVVALASNGAYDAVNTKNEKGPAAKAGPDGTK